MRFHYAEAMTNPAYYIPLAQAAEAAGYYGFVIPDSLIYPKASDTAYSYTDDGGREFLENKPFIETFTLAMAMGAATTKLHFTPNVLKLPVRPPLYSAKIASSIAVMTNNRFTLGAGLSVWPEDYAVMGVPWEKRGERFDECIEIFRGLTAGGYYEFHGKFFDIPPVKLNPTPTKPIDVLIGGHSDAALKRAARNDGWMHAGGGPDALEAMLTKYRAFRADLAQPGRKDILFSTAIGDVGHDTIARYRDLGVTDLAVVFRNLYAVEEDSQPLQTKIDDLNRFADTVIAKFG